MNQESVSDFLKSITASEKEILARYYAVDMVKRCYPNYSTPCTSTPMEFGGIVINFDEYPNCREFIKYFNEKCSSDDAQGVPSIWAPMWLFNDQIKSILQNLQQNGTIDHEYGMAMRGFERYNKKYMESIIDFT